MYCPYCSCEETKVLESRIVENSMRRRRECLKCNNRFTTYERAVFNILVNKKDGRQEEFVREKIKNSLNKALSKPTEEIVEEMTQRIEQKIIGRKTNAISTQDIGKMVMQELKNKDMLAYLRFVSVHKSLDNPISLREELDKVINKK